MRSWPASRWQARSWATSRRRSRRRRRCRRGPAPPRTHDPDDDAASDRWTSLPHAGADRTHAHGATSTDEAPDRAASLAWRPAGVRRPGVWEGERGQPCRSWTRGRGQATGRERRPGTRGPPGILLGLSRRFGCATRPRRWMAAPRHPHARTYPAPCSIGSSATSPATSGSTSGPPTPWSMSANRGIVMSEPSVVAIEAKTKKVLAIGAEAKRMVGRTPANIIAVRPLRDGVISDFDVTEQMIKYFVNRVHDRVGLIPRPRMLLGHPVRGDRGREARRPRRSAQRRRPLGAPDRGADGGRDRSRPAGQRAVGQPHRRHRRRHDRGRRHQPRWHRGRPGASASAATRWTRTSSLFARREYNLFLGERTAEDIKIAIASAYPGEWDASG